MKFEEEFPSLKKVNWLVVSEIYEENKLDTKKLDLGYKPNTIDISEIREHCLDKAKVKEIIDNSELCYLEIANQEQANILLRMFRDLRKELGLDK